MSENKKLIITPKTRVGELLDSFPELEPVLLELSPAFNKLKNPILRKTVAKVATLQQVASLGNIPVTEVINTLRSEVGQQLFEGKVSGDDINYEKPGWFDPGKVVVSFNAAPLIDSGQNPMQEVFGHLEKISPGEIFLLTTPFVPAPIIELINKRGYSHYCIASDQGQCTTYFTIPG
ncbi:MAG: DUF1858 domain-containing protein, partial [Bacteroidales bacterium]|nr:DUF1858 domain-containing protein [Bacteroidales bacterium]